MPFVDENDGFADMDFRPPLRSAANAAQADIAADDSMADDAAIAAIAAEGLTGRQLRRARLMAQKHGIGFNSDLHAVLQLRRAGLDPFAQDGQDGPLPTGEVAPHLQAVPNPAPHPDHQPSSDPTRALTRLPGDKVQLPGKARPMVPPSTEVRANSNQIAEIQRIQQDIARRRRRKVALLFMRLFVFVLLPTLCAGWYFYRIATPIYATNTQFVIQHAGEPGGGGGLGGLLAGTSLASSPEASAVQGYLQSPEAMLRLETDLGFKAHFQNPSIDALQRLAPDASETDTYGVYSRFVKISYDPTEGLIKMEVMAMDPQTAAAWANQLIKYAEEQVDQLTQRMRENQMTDAKAGYEDAQTKLSEARQSLIELQQKFSVLSSDAEVSLITSQISALEGQLTEDRLSLAQMEANANPNQARMDPVKQRIASLEAQIADLRSKMTAGSQGETSLAEVQGQLLLAQAEVETRQLILTHALQTVELARVEVSRQTRYLSVSVSPTPPDEPSYPRAFENTLVSLLIMLGIYLMVSMTAAILREQVSS